MNELSSGTVSASEWERLQPVLDEAMHTLDERDREAILLRFFEGRAFPDVGGKLGLSEEAARKRVNRALDELRAALTKRGVTSTASALVLLLMERGVVAAPAGFGPVVTTAALAGSAGAVAFWQTLTAVKVLTGIASALVAGGVIVAMAQNDANEKLRSEVAALHAGNEKLAASLAPMARPAEIRALEGEIANARRETAALTRAAAAGARTAAPADSRSVAQRTADEQMNDPAYRARMRLLMRTAIDRTYAHLFRMLHLPAAQFDSLVNLLLDRDLAAADANRLAQQRGVATGAPADAETAVASTRAEFDRRIGELLGPEQFAYYQFYTETMPYRSMLAPVVDQLRSTSTPLSDQMLDQAVELLKRTTAARGMPDSVLARLSPILAPEQLAALKGAVDGRHASAEMVELNRDAATKGLLRLNPQSLKDYPPPPGSPADNVPPPDTYSGFKVPPKSSLVSVSLKHEAATDALSLYAHLAGKELQIPPAVVAAKNKVDVEFTDMPPTAAVMLLKQSLLRAGFEITVVDEKTEAVRFNPPPS